MGEQRKLRLTAEYFSVYYQGKTSTSLTMGNVYFAKIDPTGTLRVFNDNAKWNKYGSSTFVIGTGIDITWSHTNVKSVKTTPSTRYGKLVIPGVPTVGTSTSGFRGAKVPGVSPTVEEVIHEAIEHVVKEKTPMSRKTTLTSFLNTQGVNDDLIAKIKDFRNANTLPEELDASILDRIHKPSTWFIGKSWNLAISAILAGKNILLVGEKATGKNVFAESLAYIFGRPLWDISCHTNTNAEALIGGETFKNGQVEFRPGSVYNVAKYGGFGVLDEINMAKADALAVLHSVTDRRRILDIPGYERVYCNEATRFIGTMNSGYAGTKELNEAFASRFMVIHVEAMGLNDVIKHLNSVFPNASDKLKFFGTLFIDLQKKAKNAEISTKAVDFRGILDAIELVELGFVSPYEAIESGVINKCFDEYERNIVADVVKTLVPSTWTAKDIFPTKGTITVDFA